MNVVSHSVSVIIPTFNRAHLVKDAIRSAVVQTVSPLEIVVIDDGSTDDTAQQLADLASELPLPLVYVRQENAGGNVARNRGVKAAQGAYVAFLDSDDVWHPDKLEKQLAALDARPEAGAVYCGLREVEVESGRVLSEPNRAYPAGDLVAKLLVSDVTAPTSTYVVRRSVMEAAGYFDESLEARQDWDMWIRVARQVPIAVVPEALVDFRHHAGPRTVTDPERELRAYRRIMDKYADWRVEAGPGVVRKAHAAYFRRVGRVAFHFQGDRGRALKNHIRALRHDPFALDTYAAMAGSVLPRRARHHLHRAWNGIFGRTALAIRSH